MSKRQVLLLAASTLVVGLVFGASLPLEQAFKTNQTASPPSAPASADLIIDFGDGELALAPDQSFIPGESAFDLTQKVVQVKNISFIFDPPGTWGVFVKEIGNRKNGKNNNYWQYWVNAQQVQVAADKYILQPNDVVEWKFIRAQPMN